MAKDTQKRAKSVKLLKAVVLNLFLTMPPLSTCPLFQVRWL